MASNQWHDHRCRLCCAPLRSKSTPVPTDAASDEQRLGPAAEAQAKLALEKLNAQLACNGKDAIDFDHWSFGCNRLHYRNNHKCHGIVDTELKEVEAKKQCTRAKPAWAPKPAQARAPRQSEAEALMADAGELSVASRTRSACYPRVRSVFFVFRLPFPFAQQPHTSSRHDVCGPPRPEGTAGGNKGLPGLEGPPEAVNEENACSGPFCRGCSLLLEVASTACAIETEVSFQSLRRHNLNPDVRPSRSRSCGRRRASSRLFNIPVLCTWTVDAPGVTS